MNIKRQRTVSGLSRKVQVNPSEIKSTGAVSKMNFGRGLNSFKVTFVNASSSAQNYILGDPHGIIANELSGTYNAPTSASCLVDGMKASFASNPVEIKGMQYKVSSSAAQFENDITYHQVELDGSVKPTKIHVSEGERNTANNAKLLTLDLSAHQIVLDGLSALTTQVDASETAYWTLLVGGRVR